MIRKNFILAMCAAISEAVNTRTLIHRASGDLLNEDSLAQTSIYHQASAAPTPMDLNSTGN